MAWSHKSLDRTEKRGDYTLDGERVLFGRVLIAYLEPRRDRGFNVRAVGWSLVGVADSRTEGFLMAIHHQEAPRWAR